MTFLIWSPGLSHVLLKTVNPAKFERLHNDSMLVDQALPYIYWIMLMYSCFITWILIEFCIITMLPSVCFRQPTNVQTSTTFSKGSQGHGTKVRPQESSYGSVESSDLTIICGDIKFKVHKSIVCRFPKIDPLWSITWHCVSPRHPIWILRSCLQKRLYSKQSSLSIAVREGFW